MPFGFNVPLLNEKYGIMSVLKGQEVNAQTKTPRLFLFYPPANPDSDNNHINHIIT